MSMQISLHLKNPSITLHEQKFSASDIVASYTLQFKQHDPFCESEVEIVLSRSDFEALLNQGRILQASAQSVLTGPQEYLAWREMAWPLYRLSNKEWQFLIREVSTDTLMYTLWFLKDLDLARKVMGNLSKRYAASLTEDMVQRFSGQNPEDATNSSVQAAHECLREMLHELLRLQDQCFIEKSC